MTPESVLAIGKEALEITLMLTAVLLLPGLAVGLLVAVFQAATQINEVTLSFIPKLIITFVTIMLAGPWMLNLMVEYTRRLIEDIPAMLG
ncbi:MAG: EscS/YscS/HrcS family type III secretion system export apparatus protein [Gammaproteobacteria bacterium RBG_16_57_12]|nr:MAG: EscS/YscS/HrcS family type III secretion system export apparatus protein [Gammaproteobacteria bacterium RBG_16_57_12]